MGRPRVVVIIPAYNEASYLEPVVTACLRATLPDRVVVVDDGSSDGTAERARELGAEVIRRHRNGGKAAAMTTAVEEVDAEFYAFLDADLIGIEPRHVDALIEPALGGGRVVTMGRFVGGRLRTDLAQRIAPGITGQRTLPAAVAREMRSLVHWKYAVELALNDLARELGYETVTVPLDGVTQVMKEEKQGYARGFARRLAMYRDLAVYLAFRFARQPFGARRCGGS